MEAHGDHHDHDGAQACEGCEHGDSHAQVHAADAAPHEPAPKVPRFERPDNGSLIRAIALFVLSIVSFFGAVNSLTHYGTIMAPVAGILGTVGILSMWGALIHVTGGERFDDHPWV